MNVVGKFGSLVYYAATPFHPFGGAVDIIVVQQQDGSFRSTPWYVRFGKFQGVLKGAEKIVRIDVNGVEANFHMYLDNSGEAYFIREVVSGRDGEANGNLDDSDTLEGTPEDCSIDYNNNDDSRENDVHLFRHGGSASNTVELYLQDGHESERRLYEFQDEQSSLEGSVALSEYGSSRSENLDSGDHLMESENLNSEVVLVSVDGHILTAPISSSDNSENVQLSIPQFHLGPGEATWATDCFSDLDASTPKVASEKVCNMNNDNNVLENLDVCEEDGEQVGCQDKELRVHSNLEDGSGSLNKEDTFKSCLDLSDLPMQVVSAYQHDTGPSLETHEDPHDNSPQSHMTIDGAEDGGVGESRNAGGLSLSKSYPSKEISSDLQVEVVPIDKNLLDTGHNGSDNMPGHSGSNEKKLEEQTDVALADEGIGSSPRTASKDECSKSNMVEAQIEFSNEDIKAGLSKRVEISLCGNLLNAGMGLSAAAKVFDTHRISEEEYKLSAVSIAKNENLVVRYRGKYLPWDKAAPIVLGLAAYGLDIPVDLNDAIPVEETPKSREDDSGITSTPSGRRWSLWPIPFRRVKTIDDTSSNLSSEDVFVDSVSHSENQPVEPTPVTHGGIESPHKQLLRTNIPTTEQIASLNLRKGKNVVTFIFSTRVLGMQKVEAHIYLWKWNARIVISDVDGTITKSDVLGQFMPLVGRDWTQSGVARLFSAIEENGYQLLFLSARAIVQAYLTRSYLLNLKQDGKALPSGPVVISPDGLFPSLYREVIRRAPHEFKIACLEDIKALFPSDYNPFYAGFGNRDTDELSYRKIGIPKGKIFIINPKGEVAISHRIGVRSYTSLHTLVDDMFPPTSMVEQEDYNSWNYWKLPVTDIDIS